MPKVKDVVIVIGATLLVSKVLAYGRAYVRTESRSLVQRAVRIGMVWGLTVLKHYESVDFCRGSRVEGRVSQPI